MRHRFDVPARGVWVHADVDRFGVHQLCVLVLQNGTSLEVLNEFLLWNLDHSCMQDNAKCELEHHANDIFLLCDYVWLNVCNNYYYIQDTDLIQSKLLHHPNPLGEGVVE